MRWSGIVGGELDDAHPAVVYIAESGFSCSGALVAPTIVLTAGHCTYDGDPAHYTVSGGVEARDLPDWTRAVTAVVQNTAYDPVNLRHDVGLLFLDEEPPVEPIPWLRGRDDGRYEDGTPIVAVGYGTAGGTQGDDRGTRRRVEMEILKATESKFRFGGDGENVCSGDSGGPILAEVEGRETIVGIAAAADEACAEVGIAMRTDDNAEFLAPYLPEEEGDGGGGGGRGCRVASATARRGPPYASAVGLLAAVAASCFVTRRRAVRPRRPGSSGAG